MQGLLARAGFPPNIVAHSIRRGFRYTLAGDKEPS